MSEILKRLSEQGVSIWLDDISRERLRTGNLESLIREKSVVGVTSNPTIFASALSKGDAYDTQLHDLKVRGVDLEEAVRAITTYDIRWAADVLKPVYDATRGVDGRVSIEVDPRLARDTDKTVAEARALWWMVDRPNLFIKIPATVEGLPAIAQAISEGISVNVTLIFSLERYRAVMEAWLTGLERAKANGLDLSGIESVASFFVSRVDGEIDKRLDKIGTPEALQLRGKAAVANARLAFAAFEDVTNSPRWQALAAAGARPQRPLWASTGTKNPEYPDTLYVDDLVTAGTVNTMPEKTLNAVADHSKITGDTVRPFYEQAWNTMAALKEVGIDYDDVVRFLEEDGVAKFEASWTELLSTVATELKKA
ncbi:transaldolase [Streptosporangium subroseum]|uniref:Transaldolase n=1 Tax=Streptosporangium subroseum TaxID=106412 RepID=A0A239LEX8_9ACTN|nr:transaldolase [Streptosporangium subroseum]SNT28895.1 transaldolase [Streptosporangium subroseum]